MNSVQKLTIALVAGICSLLIILSAAVLVSPWFLDNTGLKNKICSEVSRLISGEFRYSKTSLSLFPSPHIVLINPQLDIPKTLSASVDKIEVYPELMKLFTGRLVLKKTAINRPRATIWITESPADTRNKADPVELNQVIPNLLKSLSRLSKLGFSIDDGTISHGSVTLIYNQITTVKLDSLNAVIKNSRDIVTLKITSASDLFDNLSVTGSIHTSQPEGNAHIEIGKLKLGAFYNGFLPDASSKVVDGDANIGVDITYRDNQNIDVTLKGSAPNVHMEQTNQTVEIQVQSIAARININPASTTITLSDLKLGNPSMQVSGSVSVSDQSPRLNVQLEGRNIDIDSTRSVSLALAGSNSVTQTIFEIVKYGSIPRVTLSAQSDTPGGLADLDNLVLQASLTNGTIDVPGTSIALTGVSGDVGITKGILTSKGILAQWQKSTVQEGIVKIDLTRDPLPLDITADLTIDVADIPAILQNVIKDQTFNDELKKIEDLKGSASAALSLTGSTDQLKVNVSASDLQLAARYKQFPFPLRIDSGEVSYDGTKITWRQLNGFVGSSSFATFSGNLDLGENKNFEITSGSSHILVSEILPWITRELKKSEITNYYGGGKSILHLSRLTMGGPLTDFREWHFNIAGELEDLIIINLPKDPGPVKIDSLHFSVDPKSIKYSVEQLSMLDTLLTMSGTQKQYMKGIDGDAHLDFDGKVGAKTAEWFSKSFNIPSWLKIRPFSLARSELTYSNHSGRKLTATLDLQEDLKVFANVSMDGYEVIIKKLGINDHSSQATLGGSYKEPILAITFDGKLHASTFNRLFQIDNNSSTGMVDGKAQIHLNLKKANEVRFVGKLNGKNFSIPTSFKTPLLVRNILVAGTSETVSLESADLSWNDTDLSLSGTITPNFPEKPKIDLDVETNSIDVEKILATIESKPKVQDKKPAKTFSIPVVGTVHFTAKNVKTKDFTIQPLQAAIELHDEVANITVEKMGLCAILTSGTVTISPHNVDFHIKPEARGQQLNATLNCFTDKHFKADGTFELDGSLEGHGTIHELLKTISGSLELHISDGHIYHDIVLLNVLKFLNAAEVLTGRISSGRMLVKGISFDRVEMRVTLKKGTLEYEKFIFDGDEIKLSGTGKIDLFAKKIKFTLLVATQTTASTLLGYVPLIGGALQAIATIPLTIEGTIDNVHVLPLAPSAVGYELQEVTRQTFGIPLHLIHLHDFQKKVKGDGAF